MIRGLQAVVNKREHGCWGKHRGKRQGCNARPAGTGPASRLPPTPTLAPTPTRANAGGTQPLHLQPLAPLLNPPPTLKPHP